MNRAEFGADWEREFERWLAPFLGVFRHKCRRRWAPVYLRDLLGPSRRKSVTPMAALEEIDRVREAGARFGVVLADCGYGHSGPFRRALSERELAWMVGVNGALKVYAHDVIVDPPQTKPRELTRAIKARWACEQPHQQMKQELGLDHYEGRTWLELHHHCALTTIAFAFLQHLRLRDKKTQTQCPSTQILAPPIQCPKCKTTFRKPAETEYG